MSMYATAPAGTTDLVLDAYLPYRLAVASGAVSRLIARAYEDRFGLTIPQWRLICVLAEDDEAGPAILVSRTGADLAAVRKAAEGLIQRRLVERTRGSGLRLTEAGAGLHQEIAPLALAYEAALIAGLTPDEVGQLKRLLARVQTAACALAGETAG